MVTNEAPTIEASPEFSNIKAVPLKIVNKFLMEFFKSIPNCTVGNLDGINTVIIPLTTDQNTQINQLNMKMIKDYNEFLKKEFNKDPKYFNRNMVYESEIKDGKLFIRWT
jgi:hypothetical protein